MQEMSALLDQSNQPDSFKWVLRTSRIDGSMPDQGVVLEQFDWQVKKALNERAPGDSCQPKLDHSSPDRTS